MQQNTSILLQNNAKLCHWVANKNDDNKNDNDDNSCNGDFASHNDALFVLNTPTPLALARNRTRILFFRGRLFFSNCRWE